MGVGTLLAVLEAVAVCWATIECTMNLVFAGADSSRDLRIVCWRMIRQTIFRVVVEV